VQFTATLTACSGCTAQHAACAFAQQLLRPKKHGAQDCCLCVLLLMFPIGCSKLLASTPSVDSVGVQFGCIALCALQPQEPVSCTGCICLRALLWPGCVQLCGLASTAIMTRVSAGCAWCVGAEQGLVELHVCRRCRVSFRPCLFATHTWEQRFVLACQSAPCASSSGAWTVTCGTVWPRPC
jgi:hypothetical protein